LSVGRRIIQVPPAGAVLVLKGIHQPVTLVANWLTYRTPAAPAKATEATPLLTAMPCATGEGAVA